jgi:hypothetical protein
VREEKTAATQPVHGHHPARAWSSPSWVIAITQLGDRPFERVIDDHPVG